MFKKFFIVVFVLFMSFFMVRFFDSFVVASDSNDYILPRDITHRASGLDKVYEKVGLFLKLSPNSKSRFWRVLVDRRLMEMKFVAEEEGFGVFEETSSRYATYVGEYSEYVISKKLSSQKGVTKQMFNKHLEILEPLLYEYDYNSAWWLLLQQDIDTINIFKDRIEREL